MEEKITVEAKKVAKLSRLQALWLVLLLALLAILAVSMIRFGTTPAPGWAGMILTIVFFSWAIVSFLLGFKSFPRKGKEGGEKK